MRCSRRNCNHILSDFETTRKDKNGLYLDLCVYCLPYDPERDVINPKFAYQLREAYNENDGPDTGTQYEEPDDE